MNDNRMTELLPCPLCGGKITEPLSKRWTNCLGDESWSASVACPVCNLRIETRTVSYETERDAIEAVVAKWNTRTPEQAIAATLGISNESVKALIDDMLDFIGNCCETTLDFGCCDPIDCKYLSGDGELAECTRYQDFLSRAKAIAATPGRQKAKAHPYGYEPDTGAFDATRCECGCLNDISATYCNDCGGEIEIDMNAEKEIYEYSPRNSVFATKHDDGSLELGGKRYIVTTLGEQPAKLTAEQVRDAIERHSAWVIGNNRCFRNGAYEAISDELNAALGGGECEWELEHSGTLYDKWRCSKCKFLFVEPRCDQGYTDLVPNFCPNCGKAVKR